MAGVVLAACVGDRAPREEDARTLSIAADWTEMPLSSECAHCRTPCAADVRRAPVEDALVEVRGGTKQRYMLELLCEIAEEFGAELVLDDACRRRLEETKVFICGVHRVRRSELVEWLTAVLSFGDVALVPLEAGSTDARPRWACIDRRSAAVRPRAAGPDGGE